MCLFQGFLSLESKWSSLEQSWRSDEEICSFLNLKLDPPGLFLCLVERVSIVIFSAESDGVGKQSLWVNSSDMKHFESRLCSVQSCRHVRLMTDVSQVQTWFNIRLSDLITVSLSSVILRLKASPLTSDQIYVWPQIHQNHVFPFSSSDSSVASSNSLQSVSVLLTSSTHPVPYLWTLKPAVPTVFFYYFFFMTQWRRRRLTAKTNFVQIWISRQQSLYQTLPPSTERPGSDVTTHRRSVTWHFWRWFDWLDHIESLKPVHLWSHHQRWMSKVHYGKLRVQIEVRTV